MKILAVRTHYLGADLKERLSAVDWWRVQNPLTHVAKHTDIEVDFVDKIVDEGEDEEEAYKALGAEYDVLFTSYISTPKAYAWIKASCAQYNVLHIMDLDDNIFEVDQMNPAYLTYYPGSKNLEYATKIIQDVPVMTVSTEYLKTVVENYRDKPTYVLPNAIDEAVYKLDTRLVPNNKDSIVIGYQGSATHHRDIFNTGYIWGVRAVMKKYPHVRFAIVGSAFDELYDYIPEDRVDVISGERDFNKWIKLWQTLPFDIGTAPLAQTSFNRAKSSIKYFEYGLRRIPAVYTFHDPYLRTVKENETGFLAQDEVEWEEKLSWLIENKKLREEMGLNARADVKNNYLISSHWKEWEKVIRRSY